MRAVKTLFHVCKPLGSGLSILMHVVECLTSDRRTAGSSLTGVTALWSLSKTHLSYLSTGSTQEDPSMFNCLMALFNFRALHVLSWIFFLVMYLLCCHVCSLQSCGHVLGQGWPLVCSCVLSLSHTVSRVSCGTWLYRLLIFVFLSTLPAIYSRRFEHHWLYRKLMYSVNRLRPSFRSQIQ